MQTSPLLTLSPELQDMVLAECYRELTVTGEQLRTRSKTRVSAGLVIGVESTCKALRRRSLAVRALPFERAMIVEHPESFAAVIPRLQPRERYAWMCAGLAAITLHCLCDPEFEFSCVKIDWGTLLSLCPRLRSVHLDSTCPYEYEQELLQRHLPMDTEERRRNFARSVVEDEFYLSVQRINHLSGSDGTLHRISRALQKEHFSRDLTFEAVLTTILTDEEDGILCEVVRER